jgi:O-antigen ligase
LAITATTLVIVVMATRPLGTDHIQDFQDRISGSMSTLRFALWQDLVEKLSQEPDYAVFGAGLRAIEETRGVYSHNSYLDLLFETGMIGLTLWAVFAFFTTLQGVAMLPWRIGLLPWLHAWLLTLFMYLTFSSIYLPFSWLVAALIWSQSRREVTA